MNISEVSSLLSSFLETPEPFSRMTIEDLWTDPHVAQKMLAAHLDPSVDRASRRPESIAQMVQWIDDQVGLRGKNVCDLGCGPGLYATAFAKLGAFVTGLDFSRTSIEYAKTQSGKNCHFRVANYLKDVLPDNSDVVTLIYCDYCALGQPDRKLLLNRIARILKSGGCLVFDVLNEASFPQESTGFDISANLMGGFWSVNDYIGMKNSTLYPDASVTLDRFLIVEPERQREIYNWLQYFSEDLIRRELTEAGFVTRECTRFEDTFRIVAELG